MIIVKVIKYDKTSSITQYDMKFEGTNEELLEIEKLSDMAEDCYVDQIDAWK